MTTSTTDSAAPVRASATILRGLAAATIAGAVLVGLIGFAGSYAAVRALAEREGFGQFSGWLPIGVDAGIAALLALDVLLSYLRAPFALLRHTAWLLTAATIAFNVAAGVPRPTAAIPDPTVWDDPIAGAMHAALPVLFLVVVEAARHAVVHLAELTGGRAMERVRLARWVLDPGRTFLLWRRMVLLERTSYREAIQDEMNRTVYVARLKAEHGTLRRSPVDARLPLRLARYGVPLPSAISRPVATARVPTGGRRPLFAADNPPRPVTARLPSAPRMPERPGTPPHGQADKPSKRHPVKPQVGQPADPPAPAPAPPHAYPPTGQSPRPGAGAAAHPLGAAIAERNARTAEQARARRRALADQWHTLRAQEPALTKTEASRRLKTSARTLSRALAENPAPEEN
ncbi:DUF2637 domain-containing protein [Streptomyces sp. NPDC058961]|uniref:DUF2637 domain-containing protein n=1 Tax=Streptomyces sp. NPDC058961 TaxID=3346680 RepID=UPI0036B09EF4